MTPSQTIARIAEIASDFAVTCGQAIADVKLEPGWSAHCGDVE